MYLYIRMESTIVAGSYVQANTLMPYVTSSTLKAFKTIYMVAVL